MNTYLTRNLDNRTRRLNHQPRRLNFELRAVFPTFLLHPSTPIPAGTLLGPLSGIWEARHTVFVAGGGCLPQSGQVGGQFLQLEASREGWARVVGGGESLLGFGQGGEFGLPAGLQGAGD